MKADAFRGQVVIVTGASAGIGRALALQLAAQGAKVPIIGMGGIVTAKDALELIIAGATAVQVGTANFLNPGVTMEILDGIDAFLEANHIASVTDIIGTLKV